MLNPLYTFKQAARSAFNTRTEVMVTSKDGTAAYGVVTFVGAHKFRVDTELAACFFSYDEVKEIR